MYNPGTLASHLLVSARQLTPSGTYPRRPCGHPARFPTCPCAAGLSWNLTLQTRPRASLCAARFCYVRPPRYCHCPPKVDSPLKRRGALPRLALSVRSLFCPVPLTSLVKRLMRSYIVPESNRPHADPRARADYLQLLPTPGLPSPTGANCPKPNLSWNMLATINSRICKVLGCNAQSNAWCSTYIFRTGL